MKLIFAIIQADDADNVITILNQNGFMVTKMASSGGFLRKGNVTLMIGTAEEKVHSAIQIFREECGKRIQTEVTVPFADFENSGKLSKVSVGGATIFVIDVERFEKV